MVKILPIPSADEYEKQLDVSYITVESGTTTEGKVCPFFIKLNMELTYNSTDLPLSMFFYRNELRFNQESIHRYS